MNEGQFATWLREQIARAGGLREAARKASLSHSTLTAALNGDGLSLKSFQRISDWTKVDLQYLLRMYGADISEDRHVEVALARILDQRPDLRDTLRAAVEVLEDQEMERILEFIQFEVQRKAR
jgi:transcriptional regulator with XRE-family HTH domain